MVNYEQKIQAAFKEVADTLALRDSINQQLEAQQRYLDSLQITLQRARGLYSSGAVSYIEVLDAERFSVYHAASHSGSYLFPAGQ